MKFYRLMTITLVAGLAVPAFGMSAHAQSNDRHVGYYYPAPATFEVYEVRVPILPGSDRRRRVGFVTVMTNEMLKNPYPPEFAILTAIARGTPFFQEQPESDRFTFFDLAKLLGFSQITYTDGASFAHQIELR